MNSHLVNQIVFGPIHSRRLGSSLGINILPANTKWCNFNCIYCECGWNSKNESVNDDCPYNKAEGLRVIKDLPLEKDVANALELKLSIMSRQRSLPDVITFSGNGEPTLHPNFKSIIQTVVSLRNEYAPNTQVCVLSNATHLGNQNVFEGLLLADKRILKIDSAIEETLRNINQPNTQFNLRNTISTMKRLQGDFILQTLFLRGFYNGCAIDNTTTEEINAWAALVLELLPKEIMIYTLDRKTPTENLVKVPLVDLESIGKYINTLHKNIKIIIAG